MATYGDVAALAGRPRAARAVGNIMRGCGRADVPCHRVIAAGGRLGGYGGSEFLKRSLLAAEGVIVAGARIRELDRVRWTRRSEADEAKILNITACLTRIALSDRSKATSADPLAV